MIVDCYTCIWDSTSQLGLQTRLVSAGGEDGESDSRRVRAGVNPPARVGSDEHMSASEPVDAAFVLAFKSVYLGAEVPNRLVADYVGQHPDRLIGFAGVDPTEGGAAVEELEAAHSELSMRGINLAPAAQNLHPCHTNAKSCYEAAERLGMPVVFHTGLCEGRQCVLPYAQPALLDEVAREFPKLKMVIAHMGHPWVEETIALLGKHENVFAEISWLLHQPWTAYQALVSSHQYGVIDKLLFGSGFPYTRAEHCIEALYGVNQMVSGTNLPTIPRDRLRGIVERDTLGLLGLSDGPVSTHSGNGELLDDDEA